MVKILPFKAIKYSRSNVLKLVTQPFDKITPDMQKEYYKKSPYNFIRLNLPKGTSPYKSSRITLREWLDTGVIIKEGSPYYYQCTEKFNLFEKRQYVTGLLAIVKLQDYKTKMIFPHERTFPAAVKDRLKMLRWTNTNLEPIFLLYSDKNKRLLNIIRHSKRELCCRVEDENGITFTIERMLSPQVSKFFNRRKLVIADGHHRYEASLAYKNENSHNYFAGFILALLVNRYDPGLTILPSHRVLVYDRLDKQLLLNKIKSYFEVKKILKGDIRDPLQWNIVYYFKNNGYALKLRPEFTGKVQECKNINVNILNDFVFSKILKLSSSRPVKYVRWSNEALELVDKGIASFAFLVKPIGIEDVWKNALSENTLPPKSTDFYPKLASGLLEYEMVGD